MGQTRKSSRSSAFNKTIKHRNPTIPAEYKDITAEEKSRLTQCLLSALDRGLLKTRLIINYNTETCKIDEIKGLTIQTTDTGRSFKVELPRATKRRSRVPQQPLPPTEENTTEK